MRVIVAGSRTITDYAVVIEAIRLSGFNISTLISGKARGVDTLGERYAKEHGIPIEEYPALWNTYGKSAGYRRNVQMAEVADALIAITNGSIGTQHMIDIATAKGLSL